MQKPQLFHGLTIYYKFLFNILCKKALQEKKKKKGFNILFISMKISS